MGRYCINTGHMRGVWTGMGYNIYINMHTALVPVGCRAFSYCIRLREGEEKANGRSYTV
jgi:hypothetical protein